MRGDDVWRDVWAQASVVLEAALSELEGEDRARVERCAAMFGAELLVPELEAYLAEQQG